jgi:O-antigen ligase
VLGIATVVLLAGGWKIVLLLAAVSGAFAIIGYVIYSIVKGDCDRILIGWVFLFPLGYYYLSYPRTAPIIQFDRTIVLVLVACILATPKGRTWPIPRDMKRVAIAWAIFLAATLISFFQMPDVLGNAPPVLTIGRLIVEAFLLPALMGWYVLRQFRLQIHAKWLHVAVCVISLYCAALGIADVVLQRHVLTYDFSGYYFAYDPTDPTAFAFLRPSGPFVTNGSFALVGLISFFLLAFLWTVIRDDSGPARRGLHILGSSAAMLMALLTLTRIVIITVALFAIISLFKSKGLQRILYLAAVGTIVLMIAVVAVVAPGVYEDRSSSDNVYGRIAQDVQSWEVFADHPLVGVGLMNFTPVVQKIPRYQGNEYEGVEDVDFPHNNIAWIAAEMGVVGLVPYLISQVLLIVAFWRLRRRGEAGERAWKYFVFVFLGYWIPGLSWTSAQSGDLNLWFMFALCLLYRYGAGEAKEGAEPAACLAT